MSWLLRIVLFVSASIASIFVARDAPNFSVIQMLAAVIMCAAIVALIAMWPNGRSSSSHNDKLP